MLLLLSPIVPVDCSEPIDALNCFSDRFNQRYGPIHPLFYIGDLNDAVKEATGGSALQVSGCVTVGVVTVLPL